jgi:uncharacterized protein YbjT (DUF2867 family)
VLTVIQFGDSIQFRRRYSVALASFGRITISQTGGIHDTCVSSTDVSAFFLAPLKAFHPEVGKIYSRIKPLYKNVHFPPNAGAITRSGRNASLEMKGEIMKIVVIGGTGLIGSRLVKKLREHGHEAVAASPDSGVNSITGEGLAEALKGASVVVDVSNSPSWDDAAVLKFFETSTRNLLTYEAAAGVGHHVALSVVGTDRLSESGYFRAKIAQEKLIKGSSVPYSIVHATQFFEFLKGLADISTDGDKVHLPDVLFQPMAADDVASALASISVGKPINGTVEIAGPEQFRVDDLVRRRLAALKDPRQVIADPDALYSGAKISERTLVPGNDARLGETRFETWLSQPASQVPSTKPQPARKAG